MARTFKKHGDPPSAGWKKPMPGIVGIAVPRVKALLDIPFEPLAYGANLEVHPLAFLEMSDDLEQVAGLRISAGPEHTHETLGGFSCEDRQFLEADRGVDVIAQHRPSGIDIAGQQTRHAFLQQSLAKRRITRRARPHRFLEIPRQGHLSGLQFPSLVFPPKGLGVQDILLLALLGTAAEQDDQSFSVPSEVDPVAGTEVDSAFMNGGTDTLGIG
jgi:hypothetical protein